MITAGRGVEIAVFLDKLRSLVRQLFLGEHAAATAVVTGPGNLRAGFGKGLALSVAGFLVVISIEITIGRDTSHIVHRAGHRSLDAGIERRRIDGHASETADTDDTDAFGIDIVQRGEEIYRRQKVFRIDVRAGGSAGLAATFTSVGRVEGDGKESSFGHRLGIKAGYLLFYCTEGTAAGNGRQLALCILRRVHIGRQSNTVAVLEGDLLVVHFF